MVVARITSQRLRTRLARFKGQAKQGDPINWPFRVRRKGPRTNTNSRFSKFVALIGRVGTAKGRSSSGRRGTVVGTTTTATVTGTRTASGLCLSAARRRTVRCLGTAKLVPLPWRRRTVPDLRERNKWSPPTCISIAPAVTRVHQHRHLWPLVSALSPSRPTKGWPGGICSISSWGLRSLRTWRRRTGSPTVLEGMVSEHWNYFIG